MCACACVLLHLCVLMCVHIFSFCVCSISLDVCVYTPGLPSVTHSDIDLCMASVCVRVRACTHIPAIIGIQISSHKYVQLLPFFNRQSPSQGPNSMMGNKLKRMALIAHIQTNKWR